MSKGFKELFADLKAGRDVRRSQEALYVLASSTLLEPLRRKIPAQARSRLDAEDVLHEAMVRAFKSIHDAECETQRQFLAWIFRIARNLMRDQAKRMSARAVSFARDPASGNFAEPRPSKVPGRTRSPESTLERRETLAQILDQMRGPEADIIRKRWIAGQSFVEIAAAVRKTPKAVKEVYARAWKKCLGLARRARGTSTKPPA